MGTIKSIIKISVSALAFAACNPSGMESGLPGESGSSMNIRSAVIEAEKEIVFKSSGEEALPVTVYEDAESGTSISVSVTAAPMPSSEPGTKVTEVTTSTLSSFTMNGYLGDGILNCRGASDNDKNNRNFISNETVTKGDDGKWHFSGGDYQWRSCVDHHFWAYSGTPSGFEVGGTNFNKAEFSYANTGTEDLVISNKVQEWVNESDGSGNWPIETMTFKHALSEVVIDFSQMEFWQLIYEDVTKHDAEPCDEDPEVDEKYKPRLKITEAHLLTPSKGSCVATAGDSGLNFNWTISTEQDDVLSLDFSDSSMSLFAIPQDPNNNIVLFYVYDSWRGGYTPFFIRLPKMEDSSKWKPGYKYTYHLKGKLVAPYYKPLGYFDTGFKGKDFQAVAVMKNLMSQYVKEIKVTWSGLALCNSNDTPEALIYEVGSDQPTNEKYPMSDYNATNAWKDKSNVGFLTNCKHNVIANPPKRGRILKTGTEAKDYECEATFTIPDSFDPPITLWFLYDGDNGGNANWVIHNMKIEITEFKIPIIIAN